MRFWIVFGGIAVFLQMGTVFATTREDLTPRLIQTTTTPGVDQLPDDGGSFCVPTSTTMNLFYLTSQGYSRLSPGWNYANPADPANLAQAYNLDRVISGLIETSPYQGTSPENWQSGVQTYLNLMGYSGLSTSSVLETPTFAQISESIDSPDEATVMLIAWYYDDGTVQGGHGTALVNTSSTAGGNTVTIHNPEPASTIAGTADIPANAQQTFSMVDRVNPPPNSPPAGEYLVTPQNPLPRYGQAGHLLHIEMDPSGKSAAPAAFALDDTLVIGTNGGNLTAVAPLTDGTSAGGIEKRALGSLIFTGFNTTTGDNQVSGGVLGNTLSSSGSSFATPFGTGNMTIRGGATLLLQPGAADNIDQHARLEVAGGAGKQFKFGGGLATLSLDAGPNAALTVVLGGSTDGTTANLAAEPNATLYIDPNTALSNLGSSVKVQVRGTGGNLPSVIAGKMVSPAIVGVDADNTLAFLTYDTVDGFKTASTLDQNSFSGAGGQVLKTSGAFSISGDVDALALIANANISESAAGTTIQLGTAGADAGLILNNGAGISVSNLKFAGDAYIHAGGNASAVVSSKITAANLVLSTSSGSGLQLTDNLDAVESVKVNGGQVQLGNVAADIAVNGSSVLVASGTVTGATAVAAGATLRLDGGVIAGGLTMAANSSAFQETWVPGATLEGTGTVWLTGSTLMLKGVVGSETEAGALTFLNQTTDADIKIEAPLMFTLAALESEGTGGEAGSDWSSIAFTGESATLSGRQIKDSSGQSIMVQVNFADAGLVPTLADPFWTTEQSWQFIALAPGMSFDANVSWSVSDQNIFSFADVGRFSFTSDGYLAWTPVPEPSTIVLILAGGMVAFARRGRPLRRKASHGSTVC